MSQRYWAFLSYSHADEAAAAKLHRALENYTLPASVRRAHGLPRRLVPVFRDVEELEASSGLTARLQGALDESRWLIVLCSPAAVQSKYVNAEIEYFIGKHGAGKILCVLLEGEPAESYPPAIRALPDEPLAADLRTGANLQLAVLKLIAAMATVGFTELRNREAARARRQRTAIAVALGAAAIGGVAIWDLYFRVHVDYYASYVRRHGIWEGTDRLPEAVAARRQCSLRFERHGRLHPPSAVKVVNGAGYCPNSYGTFDGEDLFDILEEKPFVNEAGASARYCSASFRYQPDGSIVAETLHNLVGAPALTVFYTEPSLGQLTQKGFSAAAEGGGVRYVEIDEDERGFARETKFLYGPGLPRANRSSAFGFRYERDAEGRILSREPLNSAGEGRGDIERHVYGDPWGSLLEMRAVDPAGKPLRLPEMSFAVRLERDGAGNVVRYAWLDEQGRPMLGRWGIAAMSTEYDERGSEIASCGLGLDDKPRRMPGGSFCTRRDMTPEGWVARWRHFDGDGKPILAGGGASSFGYYYDALGNLTASAYFGLQGEPVESWRGNLRNEYERDEAGRVVRERYFGPDGRLVDTIAGAERRYRYDGLGRQVAVANFDTHGAPVVIIGSPRVPGGFASMAIERDDRGNIIARRYFGADGKPVLLPAGYASLEATWDNAGNPVEARRLGVDGARIVARDGYAVSRSRYDSAGRLVEVHFFDEHENPVRTPGESFGYTARLDAEGRVLEKTFLDESGHPGVVPGLGYARVRNTFEGIVEPVEVTYLDANGEPLAHGVTRERRRYNEVRLPLEIRYEDREGQLVAAPASGCAVEAREYVGSFNLVLEQCLDAAGKLAARKDTGWARHVVILQNARPVKDEWFDAAGKPVKPKK